MSGIDRILERLPDYFPKGSATNIYKILDSFATESDIIDANILYLDNLLAVNTTNGTDLDKIYGVLYGIPRYSGESDGDYRLRLNTAFLSQKGGTAEIIQFAVALVLGIDTTDKQAMDNAIKIEDAWIYDSGGTILPENGFGCAVCVLNNAYIPEGVNDTIVQYATDTVERTKASGVNFFVIYLQLQVDINIDMQVTAEQETLTPASFQINFPTTFGDITRKVIV